MKVAQGGGFPGFDGIRLCAAWAVVYSHCYPIAAGPSASEPLRSVLGTAFSSGDYAVQVFFIMSGMLLSASLDANTDPLRFLANRLFRIVPGFCFAIVVSMLCIGPFLSSRGFPGALTLEATWSSMYWSMSGLTDLASMSLEASRYPDLAGFLNGALWSIPYEMICYLVLLSLFLVLRKDVRVAIAAAMVLVLTVGASFLSVATTNGAAQDSPVITLPFALEIKTMPYFCGGVLFHAWFKRHGASVPLFCAALFLLLGATLFVRQEHVLVTVMAVAGPAIVAFIGMRRGVLSRLTEKIGDVSYGVYLFGWPVSLLVASLSGSTNPLVVFALSVTPVFVFAYAMHRLVEVPVANTIKPAVLRWLPRFARSFRELPVGQRAAQIVAYSICLVISVRFVIYPYPFGLNWYGPLWPQLAAVCLVMALLLWAGERFGRRA